MSRRNVSQNRPTKKSRREAKPGFLSYRTVKEGNGRLHKKELEELIYRIKHNDPDLKDVSIAGLKISNTLFNDMLDALEANTCIVQLDVSDNGLLDVGVCEIFTRLMISGNRMIRVINVSNNGISKVSGKKISQYLSFHFHITHIFYEDYGTISLADVGLTNSSEFDRKLSDSLRQKIEDKLHSNRRMIDFLNQGTNRFECRNRGVKALDSVLRAQWSDRIVALDLTCNQIAELPPVLHDYHALEEFHFSRNRLKQFPPLGHLTRLRLIDVAYNEITEIPADFCQLVNLVSLVLTDNKITHLPLFLATLPALRVLAVAGNPVADIPEEILQASSNSTSVLLLLQDRLEANLGGEASSELHEEDRSTCKRLTDQRLQSPEHFCLRPALPVVQVPEKDVCRTLSPICTSKPTTIQRINDCIWCGTEEGSIYVWDCRTMALRKKMDKVLPGGILDIIEISSASEVWVAGSCNAIAIVPIKEKETECGNIHIFLGTNASAVQSMIYISTSNRVWVATADSIMSFCIFERVLKGTVTVDSPVFCLLYHSNMVWAGCGDGSIRIFKHSGALACTLTDSATVLFKLCAVGPFVWSASNQDHLKVWMQSGTSMVHCVSTIPLDGVGIHLMAASSHAETIYTVNDISSEIHEYSPTGKLLTKFASLHNESLTSMTWSLSPDRLWTTDQSGQVCYHELKMGKKTMDRLARSRNGTDPVDSFNFDVSQDDSNAPSGPHQRSMSAGWIKYAPSPRVTRGEFTLGPKQEDARKLSLPDYDLEPSLEDS